MRPIKFDLVLDLETAKSLGLEFSPKLLALANGVIELRDDREARCSGKVAVQLPGTIEWPCLCNHDPEGLCFRYCSGRGGAPECRKVGCILLKLRDKMKPSRAAGQYGGGFLGSLCGNTRLTPAIRPQSSFSSVRPSGV